MLRKNKIFGLIGFLVLYVSLHTSAQDAHFSQFYANPLYLNPAFAGSIVCPRIVANFRDQWPAISGAYTSYSASYDQHFDALSGGIGVLFLGDKEARDGYVKTNAISLIYSYKLDLTKKVALRMALQATFQQKTLDWTKLVFPDMIDPKYGVIYETQEDVKYLSKGTFDFSAGFLIYSDKVYGGVSVNHFTQPKEGFLTTGGESSRLPMKFTAHAGALLDLNKHKSKTTKRLGDMSISPNLIVQYQTCLADEGADFFTMNLGTYFNFHPLTIGVWYRQGLKNADAIIFLFGIEYDFFKIGYSYDMSLVNTNSGGSHEISTQFKLPCPLKQRRIRALNCPSF